MTIQTHLANIVRRAKQSILVGEEQRPRTLVVVGREINQFNYSFMDREQGQDAALFMKAVVHLLQPDFVASIATVRVATEGTADQPPEQRIESGEDGLFVMVTTPDLQSELYLAKIKRDALGNPEDFEPITGLDAAELLGQISNPFLLPEEGLPDWLTERVREMMVQMNQQTPRIERKAKLH